MGNITHSQFLEKTMSKPENFQEMLRELQLISKQISQLLAKSWLPDDEDGEKIRKVLLSPNTPYKTDRIKELLRSYKINTEFLDRTKIEIDWSAFLGSLQDTNDPNFPFKYVIAYPPRPTEFNLTDDDLRTWIKDKNDDKLIPDHPYIPVTW